MPTISLFFSPKRIFQSLLFAALASNLLQAAPGGVRLPIVFEPAEGSAGFVGRMNSRSVMVAGDEITLTTADGNPISMRLKSGGATSWVAAKRLSSYTRYMVGTETTWRTAPHYAQLERDLVRGIKAIVHGGEDGLEYDFVVQPGASVDRIRLAFPDSQVRIEPDGSLVVEGAHDSARHKAPVSYQVIHGKRRAVMSRYRLYKDGQVGFEVGHYDHRRALTIDPVLTFMQMLGGTKSDGANAIANDAQGNIYVAGNTNSPDFPSGALSHTVQFDTDVFITKLDPEAKTILWSAVIGGVDSERVTAMAVDAVGSVYVTGYTDSQDFPLTAGGFRGPGAGDRGVLYALKVNANGTALAYSAILGHALASYDPGAMAVNPAGEAYITGSTRSDFPVTAGAFQTTAVQGTGQGFAARLNATGSQLVYATFLDGGTPRAMALDAAGNAYIGGGTSIYSEFPTTPGVVQAKFRGDADAFVLKLNPTGSGLVFSTLLGGSGGDYAQAIALDGDGNVYVTGTSGMGSPPGPVDPYPVTPGAAFTEAQSVNGFLTKLNPTATQILYSTYLSGNETRGLAVYAAPDRSTWVAAESGQTYGFPELNYTPTIGVSGVRLQHFNREGSALLSSTFLPLIPTGFSFAPDASLVAGYQPTTWAARTSEFPLGPGGAQDVTIAKVGFADGPRLQANVGYLDFTAPLGLDGYQLETKSFTLTSSGAPLEFAIAPPRMQYSNRAPFTFSQTRGTTPATIEITFDMAQLGGSGEAVLEIAAVGSTEPAIFIPIRVLPRSAGLRVVQASSLLPDANGDASTTLSITASVPGTWNTEQVAVPFVIQPTAPGLPSWLKFSAMEGVTPATITLTGSAKGLTSSQFTQVNIIGGGSRLTQTIAISATPGLVVRGAPAAFNFAGPSGKQTSSVGIDSSAGPTPFTIDAPSWVTVSASSNTTPALVSFTVDASMIPAGTTSTNVTVRAFDRNYLVGLNFVIGDTNIPTTLSLYQLSSNGQGSLSPGAVFRASGPIQVLERIVASAPLSTTLGGYRMSIKGVFVPIIEAGPGYLFAQMPYDAEPGYPPIELQDASGKTIAIPSVPTQVTAKNFTAEKGYAQKEDGSLLSQDATVQVGDIILVRYTGQGPLSPPVPAGTVPPPGVNAVPVAPMSATIGNKPAEIVRAGMSPVTPGFFEVYLRVPDLAPDDYFAQVKIGNTLSESVRLRVQSLTSPRIVSAANGATYIGGGLVPGSWAQIKGSGLSTVTRIWTAADFAGLGNALPTRLSGVEVKVNGIAAPVYYVSPGQISFQVPAGIPTTSAKGPANVTVQAFRDGYASNVFSTLAAANSPGIFPIYATAFKNYPAGVFLDGRITGDPSLGSAFRKARPGEAIQLFVTGLTESTSSVIPTVQTYGGVTVKIGDLTIPADAAVLVSPGLFQVNFFVPKSMANWPEGEYPISVQFPGAAGPVWSPLVFSSFSLQSATMVLPFAP